jgi:hypothetical protein
VDAQGGGGGAAAGERLAGAQAAGADAVRHRSGDLEEEGEAGAGVQLDAEVPTAHGLKFLVRWFW